MTIIISQLYCYSLHTVCYSTVLECSGVLPMKNKRTVRTWLVFINMTRAVVSAKIFETETRHWHSETETLSKKWRRNRNLNVSRPRRETF